MATVCMIQFGSSTFLTRVEREAKTLAAAGHMVVLLEPHRGGSILEQREGYTLRRVRVRSRRLPNWRILWPLRTWELWTRMLWRGWRVKANIYDARDLEPLAVGWMLARIRRARLVYSSDELCLERRRLGETPRWLRDLYGVYERFFIRRTDAVIVTDRSHGKELEDRYSGVRPIVVRNVSELVKPLPKKATLKELNGQRLKILIYQGIVAPDRGLEEAVRSLEQLEECALLVVGSGPLAEDLRMLAEDLRVADRVIFREPVAFDRLLSFTAAADAGLVLTQDTCRSDYLAAPKKFYEYLMLGVPVVASDFPEMREIVTRYGVGALVDDPSDPRGIARAVRSVFADKEVYGQMRKNARKAALTKLNWETEKKGLLVAFDRVLEGRRQ